MEIKEETLVDILGAKKILDFEINKNYIRFNILTPLTQTNSTNVNGIINSINSEIEKNAPPRVIIDLSEVGTSETEILELIKKSISSDCKVIFTNPQDDIKNQVLILNSI